MSQREADCRACTLRACHRVGLYTHISDPESDEFLGRACAELVTASNDQCPVAPPYNDVLMTFRQRYRSCLKDEGYKKIRIYLQRLCTEDWTWQTWCRYHSRRSRLSKSA